MRDTPGQLLLALDLQLAGVVLGYSQFAYPIALVLLIASRFVLIFAFDSMISLILRRVVYKVSMYITKLLNLAGLGYSSNAIFFLQACEFMYIVL